MKFYDPYYQIDPTKKIDRLPEQGRSYSGRFTHQTILNVMEYEHFAIDHWMWARAARGTRERLDAMRHEDFRFSVIPDETLFSWRMICEMYETARDALLSGKTDDEAIQAAHDYLKCKQRDTAKQIMDEVMANPTATALEQSSAVDAWMTLNWETLPEVEL